MVVHQLDAALHDVGAGLLEAGVDVAQELGMDLVLGVEDLDDVAPARRQGGVEGLGLVLGPAGVEHHADEIGVAPGCPLGHGRGLGVVIADHDHDLVGGIVEGGQAGQGGAEDGLLVPRRHEQRERQPRDARRPREPGGGQGLRGSPGVQHPPQGGPGDHRQDQRHQAEEEEQAELDRREPAQDGGRLLDGPPWELGDPLGQAGRSGVQQLAEHPLGEERRSGLRGGPTGWDELVGPVPTAPPTTAAPSAPLRPGGVDPRTAPPAVTAGDVPPAPGGLVVATPPPRTVVGGAAVGAGAVVDGSLAGGWVVSGAVVAGAVVGASLVGGAVVAGSEVGGPVDFGRVPGSAARMLADPANRSPTVIAATTSARRSGWR